MTKLIKISDKDQIRLEILIIRRNKLIELNLKNGYTQTDNVKIDKYYKLILAVRRAINDLECANIASSKKSTSKAFRGFLNPQNGLTIKDLRNLTHPNYAK